MLKEMIYIYKLFHIQYSKSIIIYTDRKFINYKFINVHISNCMY